MATKESGAKKSRVVRDNASMNRVVFLRPETQPAHARSWLWFTHGRSLAFMLITILVISTLAFTVRGSSFDYYPDLCVGSWKNPENAQGRPTLQLTGASAKSFNQTNSAVFFGGTQSVICQSFGGQAIPDDVAISRATVLLSLVVKHPSVASEPVLPPEEASSTPEASTTPAEPEFTIVDEPTEPATSSGSDAQTETQSEQTPTPAPEPQPEEQSVPTEEPAPAPEAPQPEQPAPAEAPQSEQPSAFLRSLINAAQAADQSDVLATVSYSFNGNDWQVLGPVTAANWQELALRIPIGAGGLASVADVANLRIRIDADSFTLDNPLEIYLDGVVLELSTDEFASEDVSVDPNFNLSDISVVDGLPAPVSGLVQTLSLERTIIPTEEVLPWQPYDYQIANADEAKDIMRSVATIDPLSEDIVLAGSCKKDYFTVLVFRGPEDYANAPRTALFNSAYPCDNGLYSYHLTPESLHLPVGTYYLLVADQPETGPWVPISAIMPFTIEQHLVD